MVAKIALPRILRIGAGASQEIGPVLETLGLKKPLIVTDRFIFNQGLPERLQQALPKGVESRVFADSVPDPTVSSVEACLECLKAGNHDCVVGFGGGSSIDTAKAVAVLAVLGGRMQDYKAPHEQSQPGLPIVAIPTTAGTGSEATRFTIVTEENTGEKMLCIGLAYLPVAALVDFELTLTKPMRLTADTGIDSLTHAIEAYVSRHANPFSDAFARPAMKAIWNRLPTACFEPGNRPAREAMMLAATQAGIAFSNSSVALVHGMSRPIGARFHVPHGMSNAMLLPTITEFSAESALDRYAECARIMGIVAEKIDSRTAVSALIGGLRELNRNLKVPTPKNYGIDQNEWFSSIPSMVEQAIASGSPANNPQIPDSKEIAELYRKIWESVG